MCPSFNFLGLRIHPEHRGHDVPGNSAIPVQGKPRFASLVQFCSVSVQWSALNVDRGVKNWGFACVNYGLHCQTSVKPRFNLV
jgi:hypothetical protein